MKSYILVDPSSVEQGLTINVFAEPEHQSLLPSTQRGQLLLLRNVYVGHSRHWLVLLITNVRFKNLTTDFKVSVTKIKRSGVGMIQHMESIFIP